MTRLREHKGSALKNVWLRRATDAAVKGARDAVGGAGVSPMTPIGRLSDQEMGWIATGAIAAWVFARAEQAVSEHVDPDKTIRETELDPDPWDAGAIASILPELADCGVGFSKPIGELSRDEMIEFMGAAFTLISKAMKARDLVGISRPPNEPIPF